VKILGSILGILGGLLGILAFLTYAVVGPSFDVHASAAVLNVLGGGAALTCLVASAAIVLGPGRTAGFCLLAAGLIAMFSYLLIGAARWLALGAGRCGRCACRRPWTARASLQGSAALRVLTPRLP
jgi:hypothetical protein